MPCPRCQAPLPRPGLVVCPACGGCAHWNAQAGTVDALRTPTVARLGGRHSTIARRGERRATRGGGAGNGPALLAN